MKRKLFNLFIMIACALPLQAQKSFYLYEASKAYQSKDYTKSYELFSVADSIDSISYFYDLWKYYITAEIIKDSISAKKLLYRTVKSNGFERKDLEQKFFDDIGLRNRYYWPFIDSLISACERKKCQPFIDSLHKIAALDQEIRCKINEEGWKDDLRKQMNEIDSTNTIKLKLLITQYGFPSWSLVGREGSENAWLIAQHSYTYLPEFIKKFEQVILNNDGDRKSFAYMEDRYLMLQGRPQIYGTQYWQLDSKVGFYPIIDIKNLDYRRFLKGIGPFSDLAKVFNVDSLTIYPDFLDYLTNYYPNNLNMYIGLANFWQPMNHNLQEWYFDRMFYCFPRDLEILATMLLLEKDTLMAIEQAKKIVLCGKQLGEDWHLPKILFDSVKVIYNELRSEYERLITKKEDSMLNIITSFDTLVTSPK